jgi:hypothetical protein
VENLRSGPTLHSDTSHQHQRCSYPHSPRAGCATPTGSSGHAGATANLKLTFHLDHSAGADQPNDRDDVIATVGPHDRETYEKNTTRRTP